MMKLTMWGCWRILRLTTSLSHRRKWIMLCVCVYVCVCGGGEPFVCVRIMWSSWRLFMQRSYNISRVLTQCAHEWFIYRFHVKHISRMHKEISPDNMDHIKCMKIEALLYACAILHAHIRLYMQVLHRTTRITNLQQKISTLENKSCFKGGVKGRVLAFLH
jgi:hypothetical protein